LKYFKRKGIMSGVFWFSAAMVLVADLFQLMAKNYSVAGFLLLVALLFVFDAYTYSRPYLGLDESKLIINNGLSKIAILFKDVTSIDDGNNKFAIIYTQGSSTRKLKLLLSHLKKQDKEQFIKDLKAKLGALD